MGDEDQLDRLTAYTASGPAYFFELVRLLAGKLESLGISPGEARELMVELAWGAARMMKQSDCTPEQLRNKVTSKGGVTAASLEVLRRGGLEELFAWALEANYQRAKALAAAAER